MFLGLSKVDKHTHTHTHTHTHIHRVKDIISLITFHSLIHAYMSINDSCNFIFTHQ